jgi:hypothetical protein
MEERPQEQPDAEVSASAPTAAKKAKTTEDMVLHADDDHYDEAKHGPISWENLDPELQNIFSGLQRDVTTLIERTGVPMEDTQFPGSVRSLARETLDQLKEMVHQHPLLTRATNQLGQCLLQIVYNGFKAEHRAPNMMQVVSLGKTYDDALNFLVSENPHSVLYEYRPSNPANGEEIETNSILNIFANHEHRYMCSKFKIFELIYDKAPWIFTHPKILLGGTPPIFALLFGCARYKDYDWIKTCLMKMYPLCMEQRNLNGGTLLHAYSELITVQKFRLELFEFMLDQDPDVLQAPNKKGETPFHKLCQHMTDIDPMFSRAPPEEDQVVGSVRLVLGRFPNAIIVQDEKGDTPFTKLCKGLLAMYYGVDGSVNRNSRSIQAYKTNHFDAHVQMVVAMIQEIMTHSPAVVRLASSAPWHGLVGYTRDRILPAIIPSASDKKPIEDLIIQMSRLMYPSSFPEAPETLAASVREKIQEEADLTKICISIEDVKSLLAKDAMLRQSSLTNETRESFRLWAESRLKANQKKIKSIREVELPHIISLYKLANPADEDHPNPFGLAGGAGGPVLRIGAHFDLVQHVDLRPL